MKGKIIMRSLEPLENINQLPSIAEMIKISQSLAILDAILMPEWEYRYFSYNKSWNNKQYMASMRDGEGSHYYILFDENNKQPSCLGKIYDRDQSIDDKVYSMVNKLEIFKTFLEEVAFENDKASFYFHFDQKSNQWRAIPKEKNIPFLGIMKNKQKEYIQWAEEYYETKIDAKVVTEIFEFKRLDERMISNLNPNIDLNDLLKDINEIGYPY